MIEAEKADERDFEGEKAALEAKHAGELRERDESHEKTKKNLQAKVKDRER